MGILRERWRHAFAVDPEGPIEPTPEQQVAVDWVCREVARRHLTVPGIIFIEMFRPLNWIGAQALHYFSPAIWALAREQTHDNYQHFAKFIEQRGAASYMTDRIEHFEHEFEAQQEAAVAQAKDDARDGSASS